MSLAAFDDTMVISRTARARRARAPGVFGTVTVECGRPPTSGPVRSERNDERRLKTETMTKDSFNGGFRGLDHQEGGGGVSCGGGDGGGGG